MIHQILFSLFMLISMAVSASCTPQPTGVTPISPTPETNMPNPASVYCEQNGGRVETRQDASGGAFGMCLFPDGSECDEWAYSRGACQPGESLVTPKPVIPTATHEPQPTTAVSATSAGWLTYQNQQLGYSFQYPVDSVIGTADDPLAALTITGPLVGDEHWPVISISHPNDREEYLPPEGVDLEQWLTDHYLLMPDEQQEPAAEIRQPDIPIAGTTAIHTRFARSPQSYAYDKYYFAHSGQLYMVVIVHTGDKEDWELYNHFLQSIQFDGVE